jgi:drug/metabolite transporter (DMT)-like permease
MPQGKATRARLAVHGSNLFFAFSAFFVKLSSYAADGWFASLARFVIGGAIGLACLAALRRPLRVKRFSMWAGRGFFGAVSMVLYYISIDLGSAGRASLLNNTYPIFVALIGLFARKRRARPATLAGIVLSMGGVAMVFWDGAGLSPLADACGLASGILASVSLLFNKKASETEDPIVIYLGVCLVGTLACSFSAPQAASLDLPAAAFLGAMALTAFLGQVSITKGLRELSAEEGSLISYLKIPIAILISWAFLGERLSARFLAGTGWIVLGLLLDRFKPAWVHSMRHRTAPAAGGQEE